MVRALMLCLLAGGCTAESALAAGVDGVFTVEVDVLSGVEMPTGELERGLELCAATFGEVGIEAVFEWRVVDGIETPKRLVNQSLKSAVLAVTRDRDDAVHVVIAARGAGAHGVTHYRANVKAPVETTGVFVFADTIADDFVRNELLASAGIEAPQLLARTLAHELGHALGCGHPSTRSGAGVMLQNSSLGAVTPKRLARWKRALNGDGMGYPRFEQSDRECLDLDARLSVELARPSYAK